MFCPYYITDPSTVILRWSLTSSIALGTCFLRHPCSSLVPSTSRSWLPLESGFGWIRANSALLSPVFQPLPSLEALCCSRHPHYGSFRWRCIFFSLSLVSIFFYPPSFFSRSISPTTGHGNITARSGNDGTAVSARFCVANRARSRCMESLKVSALLFCDYPRSLTLL